MTDLERFIAAADALDALAMKARNATNNAFAAGTEEREGGSGRRQGKMMDQYEAWHKELSAALTEYRAARAAITPQTPPAFATSA
jgi:hypothetical protein